MSYYALKDKLRNKGDVLKKKVMGNYCSKGPDRKITRANSDIEHRDDELDPFGSGLGSFADHSLRWDSRRENPQSEYLSREYGYNPWLANHSPPQSPGTFDNDRPFHVLPSFSDEVSHSRRRRPWPILPSESPPPYSHVENDYRRNPFTTSEFDVYPRQVDLDAQLERERRWTSDEEADMETAALGRRAAEIWQIEQDAKLAAQLEEEEESSRQPEPTPPTHDCVVCGESVLGRDLPTLSACSHPPETCADCYAHWIATQLENKGWDQIKCPATSCEVILHHHEVKEYATHEVYERFDTLSARTAFNDLPNLIWCRRPGCTSGQIHESGTDGNIFQCVACGFRMCTVHNDIFHEGETCSEYDYRTSGKKQRDQERLEKANVDAIGKFTKKCPGTGCEWRIEKNEGCDHMTCSKCWHEFCWSCLADYNMIRRHGNSRHKKDCRYHANRVS